MSGGGARLGPGGRGLHSDVHGRTGNRRGSLPPACRRMADVDTMARRGLRVLGVAAADANADALPDALHGFAYRWLGLVGFADPLRPGVAEAVAEVRAAGVRVIMLTGDHLETARVIAFQAGLATYG